MAQTLTREKLKALKPCDDKYLDMFGEHESMNIEQAFDAGFTISDIFWLMGRLNKRKEIIAFANFCVKKIEGDSGDDYAKFWLDWASDDYAKAANDDVYWAASATCAAKAAGYSHSSAIREEQKKFLMELLK